MINVLYIAVGEGGSDQALITLIKELKSKIRPYVTLGKLASQSTINKLKSENIPYSILNYDFFWYPSKKNLWNYITRPIYAFKLKNKKKNLQLIQESLQEFVDNNIVIDSFELKNGVFIINFLPLSEAEIQDLNFDKTKMIDNAH